MPRRRRELYRKLLVPVIGALLVLEAVAVVTLGNIAHSTVRESAFEQMEDVEARTSGVLLHRILDHEAAVNAVAEAASSAERAVARAGDPELRSLLVREHAARATGPESGESFSTLYVVDASGEELLTYRGGEPAPRQHASWSERPEFVIALRGPARTHVFSVAPGGPHEEALVIVRAYLGADGEAAGVVAGTVSHPALAAYLAQFAFRDTGVQHLVRVGPDTAHLVPAPVGTLAAGVLPAAREPVRSSLDGLLAVAAPVRTYPRADSQWEEQWWVTVTIEEAEVLAAARQIQIVGAASSLVLLVGLVGVVVVLIRNATRPIATLVEAAQKIGSGEFKTRVDLRTGDELETLGEAMNAMGGALEERERDLHRYTLQRVHTEKLASLGSLVAGVAHEINNPLAFIKGNDELERDVVKGLLDDPALPPRVREELAELTALCDQRLDGVRRIQKIVTSLRQFSKPSNERRGVDVAEVIESSLTLAAPRTRGRVRVNTRVHPGIPTVVGNADELGQVFLNLIVNAADAMGDEPGRLDIYAGLDADGFVRVEFHDSGPGVPPEVAEKLFNPFFTTKSTGTGLGLSISHRIVTEHGGSISHRNAADRGAVFTVRLPAAPEPAPELEGL